MDNDLISRKEILDYLKAEKDKIVASKHSDVIPAEARMGALLSIKAMMCFITQIK